ncbi:MAG TPA: energy-coupling factor transporter transmembrane component T [Candidatus Dormibacteraeota bacterium]|jgi:energy-coupling factor transport system permease protein|nr:energy-coupling factor transporter transmembrane component T [Candidatus Dormibacteraeota bacterium]
MSSRAFAAWSAAALVVVLTSTNPVYRGLVLLLALNVLLALRRPDARLRPLFIAVGVAALLAAVLNAALSHTGQHVLFTVPEQLPGIGGPVTTEAVVYGADVAIGMAAAVLAIAPLSRVLHPHDLVDAFPAPLQRTAALTGAALNLVPAMARNAVAIHDAQRMRGSSGGRLRDWHAVAAPVVLSALDDSVQLAEAMDARGFGSGPRTRYVTSRIGLSDAAVIGGAVAAAALTVAARLAGSLPDWYPFPVATLPTVSALPVVACLLLAVPLTAWHRS